jgi:signal transduction histidine kinase
MLRSTRRAAEHPRATLTVALLALALVLTAVLAYQAQDAARSHRAAAERTLRDYASFATWQFNQHARMRVLTTLVSSFVLQMTWINQDSLETTLPSVERFASVARDRGHWCDCLDSVDFFFRYDWHSRALRTTADPLPPALTAWIRDTVGAHERIFPPPQGMLPLPYGSSGGGSRRLGVVITNDSYVIVFGGAQGKERVIAYVISRTLEGAPIAAYGFVSAPAAFAAPILATIPTKETLLPPSLMQGIPQDSVLTISVSDRAGHELYRSRGVESVRYTAADTMDNAFGRLVVRASIRPDIAERLIVGGLPRSRLPLLIAVFALTAGLLGVALVQLRRQQELARLRTDFVAGVSHELRTPLSQIRWFAELLHMGRLRSEAERQRSARIIDQEARRLTFLVENVLSFARGGQRVHEVIPERSDLAAEVAAVIEMFAPVAETRGVRLHVVAEEQCTAMADRAALRQILLNLLDNAVKYGPPGQTVTIAVARGAETTQLSVEDEGPGIPEEECERVFEPFVRLERASKSSAGGSGIGLAVVRELVGLQGGRVWLESGRTGGTRIVVELESCAPDAAPAEERPASPNGVHSGARV